MQFPYATTISGLNTTITQLRSAFPTKLSADILRKWGIAANNESSILTTLRFLNIIDEEGGKNPDAAKAFVKGDEEFKAAMADLILKAYHDMFDTYGDNAWATDKEKLIGYFRTSDETSQRVGEQQAATFLAVAAFAGKTTASTNGGGAAVRRSAVPRRPRGERAEKSLVQVGTLPPAPPTSNKPDWSVAVRVEINLPVTDDQKVYDNIFRSIRENLIHAPA